uniref:Uncharacterized protein n=1 Tax=Anguilla anguilla TaxID=7936 RepID=A0A0E9QLW7_ANGAN
MQCVQYMIKYNWQVFESINMYLTFDELHEQRMIISQHLAHKF